MNNAINISIIHFEQLRNKPLRIPISVHFSYFKGLLICKLGCSALLPFRLFTKSGLAVVHYFFNSTVSSLFIHILHIPCLCINHEMIRTNAGRIVALVKNTHSQWNRSFICQNPRNSMRKCWIFKNLTCLKLSITHTILRPFPVPAFIRSKNFYFRPKIDHKIFRQKLLKLFRGNNLCSHSVSFVNCLPRSRLFVQREGTLFYTA